MALLPVKLRTSPIKLREGKAVTGVAHQQEQRLTCWMSCLERASKMFFSIQELVTDKDLSVNATFCHYFPEGTMTYCHNHYAKTLRKNLEIIKETKCEV